MPPDAPDYFEEFRRGRITHFEAMASFFSHTPADPAALEELLRDTRPDPKFGPAAERLREEGWDLIIVSAGSGWYIERILRAAGVEAPVHSNPGRIEEGRGLVLEYARESPFFCEQVGVDKAAVVRDAMSRYERVAFAGDGPPDLAPALLVPEAARFARSYLAEELELRGERYRPYSRWSQIVDELLGPS